MSSYLSGVAVGILLGAAIANLAWMFAVHAGGM